MPKIKLNTNADNTLSKGALSILREAEELFATKGFDAVSINDIAKQAGVSKANIFHHFQSKDGLFLEVLKIACNRSAQALDAAPELLPDDPLARINNFFSGHLQALLAQPRSTRLIQWELMMNGEQRGKRLAEEVFAETFSRVVSLVREAQSHEIIKSEVDASLLAFLLIGANVFFFETRDVLKHLPDVNFAKSPEQYSTAVFDLLARGFEKVS
ncbi:MAG: TetR family transcriptional regulator [Thiotrichaceae bacterium]|nr:MAG: TetR family transcriptional regulator [Thiotrichaceae bacterium]